MDEHQLCTSKITKSISCLRQSNKSAYHYCNSISARSKTLESLTSPASGATAALTLAGTNLISTSRSMQRVCEKFQTTTGCNPTIKKVFHGSSELLLTTLYELGSASVNIKNNKYKQLENNNSNDISDEGEMSTYLRNKKINNAFENRKNNKNGCSNNKQKQMTIDSHLVLGPNPLVKLNEHDVHAATDSMEIIEDSYCFFSQRLYWKSSSIFLSQTECIHQLGVKGMCTLMRGYLLKAGPAIRLKRAYASTCSSINKLDVLRNISSGIEFMPNNLETAKETRLRLRNDLKNRVLMRSIGDYQEYMPLDARKIRELRAIVEYLSGKTIENKCNPDKKVTLTPKCFDYLHRRISNVDPLTPAFELINQNFSIKVDRIELVGSGQYANILQKPFKSKYPHLNAYANTRKYIACTCLVHYYNHLCLERKLFPFKIQESGEFQKVMISSPDEIDLRAKNVIRCLEHSLVIVQGEKSVFTCVVAPSQSTTCTAESMIDPGYKYALVQSYSYVMAPVVDRMIDIIESFFSQGLNIGSNINIDTFLLKSNTTLTTNGTSHNNYLNIGINLAVSLVASGLRILDGVRILGPSLAKLCKMTMRKKMLNTEISQTSYDFVSIVAKLCIGIHRITVKYCAQTLEILAKSVKSDSFDNELIKSIDYVIAPVSSNVVQALVSLSPFMSAYRSITKRRSLPWDPITGDQAGGLEKFLKYIITRLLHNLQLRADKSKYESRINSDAKSKLYMMNNSLFLIDQFISLEQNHTTKTNPENNDNNEDLRLPTIWFKTHISRMFEVSKIMYLKHWNNLNKHLTAVDHKDLEYQNSKLLSLESGRLLKKRFSGFNVEFENIYLIHRMLIVINAKFRIMLLSDIKNIFLSRYERFYDKYSKIQFSKKNMDEYLKYPPRVVEKKIDGMFILFQEQIK